MLQVRTYDLKRIAANAHVSSKEEADELEAQCVDCGNWIKQTQARCVCGSLISWKNSRLFKETFLVYNGGMPYGPRELLKMANARSFRNGREYHRAVKATVQLSGTLVKEIMRDVRLNLKSRGQFNSRAFIKYALNVLEQRAGATTARSSLLEGEDVFRG